jgi:hypothetical protein
MSDTSVLWWSAGINLVGLIAAPITALWVQRRGDDSRAIKRRREELFRTLWTNRARPVSFARVDALNMIDVEFHGEPKVIDAWADLFAHFNRDHAGTPLNDQLQRQAELYSALLYEMGQLLGYKFGKAHIRDDIYRPGLHNEVDNIDLETRRLWLQVLKQDALPVQLVPGQPAAAPPETGG